MDIEKLKYPIGKFRYPEEATEQVIRKWAGDIKDFPKLLLPEVKGLSDAQLEWKYRPGSWTLRQLIHHCADSHMNALFRFKLALTEDIPNIKAYDQDKWAQLPDTKLPIGVSLQILEGIHARWSVILDRLSYKDFQKEFFHPEHTRTFSLMQTVANYSWHCRHHLEHVRQGIKSKGSY